MPSDSFIDRHPVMSILGATVTIAAVGALLGGAIGWIGGNILDDAGFELDDADGFGYVGLIGGAEVGLMAIPILLKALEGPSGRSSGEGYSWTSYYLLGLATFAFLGFGIGALGMSQVLEFNDTLMSNLEQNERIWTAGAACATGAATLYLGASAVVAAGVGAFAVKERLSTPRALAPS